MSFLRGLHFLLLVALVYFSNFSNAQDRIDLPTTLHHPMELHSALSTQQDPKYDCLSWRLAVETNNLQNWMLYPQHCADYVKDYMLGVQYKRDTFTVTAIAYEYVQSLELNDDGKDVFIFDVDDTCVSSAPFLFGDGSGSLESFIENAPAIPAALDFYRRLLRLGVKVVFLTGLSDAYRESRERNMRNNGFHTWEMMILRNANELPLSQMEYKTRRRAELEKMGYRIIGNIGDQWTDLLGPSPGLRTFKMPNPMYHAP